MNRCSKLLRYVYEIPNAFITRISQAEPKKLTSHRALWTYILSIKMRQNSHIGIPIPTIQAIRPVFNNPSYCYNVFAKRMLKTGNAVELAGFFNANLNPVVADVVFNLGLG